jgi:dinuclear metal center YbgI/SA1388 family protein
MTTLSELIGFAQNRWPLEGAAEWDRPGLAIGDPKTLVQKVLLSVDVTLAVIAEANQLGAQLIFSHHPPFLRGVTSLAETSLKGNLATQAIRSGVAVYVAHTNADFGPGGVSYCLASQLGLTNLEDLVPGEGVVGELPTTISLIDYARAVAKLLPSSAQGILVQGDPETLITRVGLVAGAGDGYLDQALAADLDLFITSDLRHHPSSDFRDSASLGKPKALMSISHFAAEWPWLSTAAKELESQFDSVEFVVSEINTDPWDFAVMQ